MKRNEANLPAVLLRQAGKNQAKTNLIHSHAITAPSLPSVAEGTFGEGEGILAGRRSDLLGAVME